MTTAPSGGGRWGGRSRDQCGRCADGEGSGLDRAAAQHHGSTGEGEQAGSGSEQRHRAVRGGAELATGVHGGRSGGAVTGRRTGRLERHGLGVEGERVVGERADGVHDQVLAGGDRHGRDVGDRVATGRGDLGTGDLTSREVEAGLVRVRQVLDRAGVAQHDVDRRCSSGVAHRQATLAVGGSRGVVLERR